MDTDALIEQMQRDELDGATKLTPVRYGKLRKVQPQLVYYHIRRGHLELEVCACGSKVIDVKAADDLFAELDKKKNKGAVQHVEPDVEEGAGE